MRKRLLVNTVLSLTLLGGSVVSVCADDTVDTALNTLNNAKETLQTIENERSVYGDEITAFDFLKYHAEKSQDTEAQAYIEEHFKDLTDPKNDESLTELQTSIQYVIDINTLREDAQLSALQISDVYMLELTDSILNPKEEPASPQPSQSASTETIVYGTTIPTEGETIKLSTEMSSTEYSTAGIAVKDNAYQIELGKEETKYEAQTYLDDLNAFIQKYVTDYETAVNAVEDAQNAYDNAVAEQTNASVAAVSEDTEYNADMSTANQLSIVSAAQYNLSPIASNYMSGAYQKMYRVYNPNSGEHFYTANSNERDQLVSLGWNDEGIGWYAPQSSSTPVYRLYNANAGDHHYTTSTYERDSLINAGWRYENIGWYSDDAHGTPLYRQYNPNATAGAHNYTINSNERDSLVSVGWNDEGIGWYGLAGTFFMEGVDISEHNGDVDMSQFNGYFVIIRASYGTNTDKKFLRNVQLCEQLGIPYGLYVYSYALDTDDASSEAEYFLNLIKDCHPTVGVWFDMEDADGYKRTYNNNFMKGSLISDICKTFCSQVQAAGYHTGIYASQSWFEYHISGCEDYDQWLANWNSNDGSFTNMYDWGAPLHQFTSTPLDRDVMYVDISHFTN